MTNEQGSSKPMQHLYTGNDVSSYTMELVEARRAQQHAILTTGIAPLDKYMKPWLPGELIFVLGFTSHGKTALMQAMCRNVVGQLAKRESTDEIAVYASWETLVEELGLYDLASMTGIDATRAWYGQHNDAEAARLRNAAMRRAGMPLWVLGDSLKRRREGGGLTVPTMQQALLEMEDSRGIKPAVIFADYLQIIPSEENAEFRIKLLHTVDALRDMGRRCGAPVVVGCQASRKVLDRSFKLPEIGDGAETSQIERDADKLLAIWYPCKSEPEGEYITELGEHVTDDLMVLGIRKQRHAASGQVFPVRFEPGRNLFTSWIPEAQAIPEEAELEF